MNNLKVQLEVLQTNQNVLNEKIILLQDKIKIVKESLSVSVTETKEPLNIMKNHKQNKVGDPEWIDCGWNSKLHKKRLKITKKRLNSIKILKKENRRLRCMLKNKKLDFLSKTKTNHSEAFNAQEMLSNKDQETLSNSDHPLDENHDIQQEIFKKMFSTYKNTIATRNNLDFITKIQIIEATNSRKKLSILDIYLLSSLEHMFVKLILEKSKTLKLMSI